jgi:hypothetical protein
MIWLDQANGSSWWQLNLVTATGDVNIGGIYPTTNQLVHTGRFLSGDAGSPSMSFTQDFGAGFYLIAGGAVGLSGHLIGNGDVRAGGKLMAADGSAGAPGITFTTDNSVGLYRIGGGVGVKGALSATGSVDSAVSVGFGGGAEWRIVREGTFIRQYFTNSSTHRFDYNQSTGNFHIATDGGDYMFANTGDHAFKITAGGWSAFSDERIKERIEDYTTGLDEILALRPRVFSFRAETGFDTTKRHVSLIAQEAGIVMPDTVSTAGTGMVGAMEVPGLLSFDPTNIQYALINAIKAIHQRVTVLEGAPA